MQSAPREGWTRPSLASIAGVVANGGVDKHLRGLKRLGLLVRAGQRPRAWVPPHPRSELAKALRRVLVELDGVREIHATSQPPSVTRR